MTQLEALNGKKTLAIRTFKAEEKFGLISQLRRAASSVPTNIVEGYKKKSRKELLYFLNHANSSLEETKYHLILSKDLEYLSLPEFEQLEQMCNEVGRMLFGLQRSLPLSSL